MQQAPICTGATLNLEHSFSDKGVCSRGVSQRFSPYLNLVLLALIRIFLFGLIQDIPLVDLTHKVFFFLGAITSARQFSELVALSYTCCSSKRQGDFEALCLLSFQCGLLCTT